MTGRLRLDALPQLRRGGARFFEIVSILLRHGFAEKLEKIEPQFVQRWLRHEDVSELAARPLGERARLACEELGPTFIKIGQILSTRPDVVSPEVASELAKLRTSTPADPFSAVRRVIEESLCAPLETLYGAFDPVPLASASIGQVHAARLHDGRAVVVKVQHPGIEDRVQVDFDVVLAIAEFLDKHDDRLRAFQLQVVAEEVRRTLMSELDFRRELRHLTHFRRAFQESPTVAIPEGFEELSAKHVLTMEHMPGYSIADRAQIDADGHDPARLAVDGARVFLDMVFRDGVFHADPHPGNVLVQPDGRIALIDFGMVAHLDDEGREGLVDLLIAFVRRDHQSLERAVEELAEVPMDVDRRRFERDLVEFQAEVTSASIEELDVSVVLGEFTALLRRHRVLLPPAISMLVKVLVMLDGTAQSLDRRISLMELVQPYCEEVIRSRRGPRAAARRAASATKDWLRVGRRVPNLLDQLARGMERGQLKVDMVHSGLEATVDRLVSGILCAAMLLGGSVMWALKAPPVFFGVPVVGVLATSLALLHGLRILYLLRQRD